MQRTLLLPSVVAALAGFSATAGLALGDPLAQASALRTSLAACILNAKMQLELFDQINRRAVAQGAMSMADADQRLLAKGQELTNRPLGTADVAQLQSQHYQAASQWYARVTARIGQGAQ